VYRRTDDPALVGRNDETFHAVHAALQGGSAIALFPEGISHSEPGLAPLKTGAARIALGAVSRIGHAFPIIPVGLVFRQKDRFRSEAHAVVGSPVSWDDLASRSADDHTAVRELTARIERSMRQVTLNLARWEDESVVRCAEGIWAASHEPDPSPAAEVTRLATTADALARLRMSGDARWDALSRDVADYARVLRVLRLRPADVQSRAGLGAAARWALRRLTAAGILQACVAVAAIAVFWVPYRVTGMVARAMTRDRDTVSTYRVLAGAGVFAAWIIAWSTIAGVLWGWLAGVAAVVALPSLAVAGPHATEHSRWTVVTARRWLLIRGRDPRIEALRERQLDLSRRLDEALTIHTLAS
jgi:hypothetical protein